MTLGRGLPEAGLLSVARVAGPHGIRGGLRVRPHHEDTMSLAAGRQVTLRLHGTDTMHTLTRVAPHGRGYLLVELHGLHDRTTAEQLAGSEILVPSTTLPSLPPDEFYYHEMPGYRVETVDGTIIGDIIDTMHTGTTDVWIVRAGAREHLIPVVRSIVASIDRTTRRVRISPIPGLLD